MTVTVVELPAPVVSLDQAKRHLRVEHDDDDAYIGDLVEAATAWIDGPAGWLGRALGEQILEVTLPAERWRCDRMLPLPPLREIVSETAADEGRSTVVRFKAGYAEGNVPAPIRHAILLMVGDLYANRESGGTGAGSFEAKMPTTVENLLAPFRVWRV